MQNETVHRVYKDSGETICHTNNLNNLKQHLSKHVEGSINNISIVTSGNDIDVLHGEDELTIFNYEVVCL